MRIRLAAQALGQRFASLEASLRSDGEVTRPIPDREPPDETWYLDIRVAAPGYGLPQAAVYRYQEWWHPHGGAWGLTAYAYDYRFGPSLSGVFGHHWHEMRGIDPSGDPVYHVKCVDPARPDRDPHFRSFRMDIWEARDALTRLDAADEVPTCAGLFLLR